jgi:hypothetical protein
MIIFWFCVKSLAEYLELMRQGKLGEVERPKKCNCGKANSFWVHGSYLRWVEAFADKAKIKITRFKCKVCGNTVSVFPCFVIPGYRYAMEVVADGIEGYATTATTYRNEATKLGIGPSPSQLFKWVAFFLKKTGQLLLDVQERCVSNSIFIPEDELEQAEIAKCPNAWKAQLPGKDEQLHGLAKLVAFCMVLLKQSAPVKVLQQLGRQFLQDVEEMKQIFTSQIIFLSTPHTVKP